MDLYHSRPRILTDLDPPPPPEPFHYHFFVSYTSREQEVSEILPVIDAFVAELRRAGFSANPIFLDRAAIGQFDGSDRELARILRQAIHESLCMIAFISPGYLQSPWCCFEWLAMHCATWLCLEARLPMILPIVWKKLGNQSWSRAGELGLQRLPDSMRVIYPLAWHVFFPPKLKLAAADWGRYFPIETHSDRMGWERAVRESADFLIHRSRIRYHRPDFSSGCDRAWHRLEDSGFDPDWMQYFSPDRYPETDHRGFPVRHR